MLHTTHPNKSIQREVPESRIFRKSSGLPHVPITFVKPVLAGWAHVVVEEEGCGSIYLGPQQVAGPESAKYLRLANITGIVNCTKDFPNAHKTPMEYSRVALQDVEDANIVPYLDGATEFLHRQIQQGRSVLVHCQMGISRSSTVVIAYLMRYHDLSRDQAYRHVKERRPCIRPNKGFWQQLEVYEARLREESTLQNLRTLSFNRDWAEQSLARFQTIGHLSKDQRKCFPEIRPETNAEQVLTAATDFLFDRGVLEVDLPWFGALCFVLSQINCDLETFLFDDGSESWCQRSPKHVDRITSTIRKSIGSRAISAATG